MAETVYAEIPTTDLTRMVRAAGAELARRGIGGPRDVLPLLAPWVDSEREHVVLIARDRKGRTLSVQELTRGTDCAAVFSPRDILRSALLQGADSIIVAHNHPSGDPTPSQDDIAVTSRLAEAARVVECPLVDHLVITGTGAWSFKEHDLL